MTIRYRDDMLQADAAFEAEAPGLPALFAECGRAMFGVMADLDGIGRTETRKLDLEDASVEMLLHRWLSDLIFLKDKDSLLFSGFDVRIEAEEDLKKSIESQNSPPRPLRERGGVRGIPPDNKKTPSPQSSAFGELSYPVKGEDAFKNIPRDSNLFRLRSAVTGEKIDPGRHILGSDVKGVSFYKFALKFEKGVWKAFIVCDL